jgi:hypothetical protein
MWRNVSEPNPPSNRVRQPALLRNAGARQQKEVRGLIGCYEQALLKQEEVNTTYRLCYEPNSAVTNAHASDYGLLWRGHLYVRSGQLMVFVLMSIHFRFDDQHLPAYRFRSILERLEIRSSPRCTQRDDGRGKIKSCGVAPVQDRFALATHARYPPSYQQAELELSGGVVSNPPCSGSACPRGLRGERRDGVERAYLKIS